MFLESKESKNFSEGQPQKNRIQDRTETRIEFNTSDVAKTFDTHFWNMLNTRWSLRRACRAAPPGLGSASQHRSKRPPGAGSFRPLTQFTDSSQYAGFFPALEQCEHNINRPQVTFPAAFESTGQNDVKACTSATSTMHDSFCIPLPRHILFNFGLRDCAGVARPADRSS